MGEVGVGARGGAVGYSTGGRHRSLLLLWFPPGLGSLSKERVLSQVQTK